MNTAVLWSPFFVSFAVGQLYLPNNSAWLGIIFGLFVALFFNFFSIRFLIGSLSLKDTIETIACVNLFFQDF